jgi:hypothetical protein
LLRETCAAPTDSAQIGGYYLLLTHTKENLPSNLESLQMATKKSMYPRTQIENNLLLFLVTTIVWLNQWTIT